VSAGGRGGIIVLRVSVKGWECRWVPVDVVAL